MSIKAVTKHSRKEAEGHEFVVEDFDDGLDLSLALDFGKDGVAIMRKF